MPEKTEKSAEVTQSRLPAGADAISNPGEAKAAVPVVPLTGLKDYAREYAPHGGVPSGDPSPVGKFTPATSEPVVMPGGVPVPSVAAESAAKGNPNLPTAGALRDAFMQGFEMGHKLALDGAPASVPSDVDAKAGAVEAAVDPKAKPPKNMRAMTKDGVVHHVHQDTVDAHRVAGWQELLPDGSIAVE